MTKKCFAAIKSAKELTENIQKTINIVQNGILTSEQALQRISDLNGKYIKEFGDVDPYWQAPKKEQKKEIITGAAAEEMTVF